MKYAAIEYYWKDDSSKESQTGIVKLSLEVDPNLDDMIFYYCKNLEELKNLDENFIITKIEEI
ncbi:MAG: hypothetical protein RL308_1371 [Bacteroidota bacterium]|jgi:hypothetical protein